MIQRMKSYKWRAILSICVQQWATFFGSKPNVSSVKWSSCILLNALDAKWSSICKGKWRYTWLVRIHRLSHSQYSNNCSTLMNTCIRPGPKVADCTGLSFVFVCRQIEINYIPQRWQRWEQKGRKESSHPAEYSGSVWTLINGLPHKHTTLCHPMHSLLNFVQP